MNGRHTPPAVHIQKTAYTLAAQDGIDATLTMYGDICEQRPVDPWTGKPVEGQFILLDEFLTDLKQIEGCKALTIRMNSYGGDAGVSNTIHNRLRELSRAGTALTCVVDGAAMSGGSLIMCACDTVRVNPSSLIMIHNCWTLLWGCYNAAELRELSEMEDAYDRMQMEVYRRKTGLDDAEILGLMAETTFMTGREAVEKGFADELIEGAQPLDLAASADGRVLFVRGRPMHLAAGMSLPDTIPTVDPGAAAPVETNKAPEDTAGQEGGDPMTIQELRAQYPEQVAQVEAEVRAAVDPAVTVNTAVQAERDRLAAIDEVAGLFDPELVREAKYGDAPCTAAELALKAAQKAAQQGKRFLADALDDARASGTGAVGAAPPPDGEADPVEQARADARAYNESKKKEVR